MALDKTPHPTEGEVTPQQRQALEQFNEKLHRRAIRDGSVIVGGESFDLWSEHSRILAMPEPDHTALIEKLERLADSWAALGFERALIRDAITALISKEEA